MPVERTIAWWEECVADLDRRVVEARARAEAAEADRDRYRNALEQLREAAQAACDTGRPAEIRKLAAAIGDTLDTPLYDESDLADRECAR